LTFAIGGSGPGGACAQRAAAAATILGMSLGGKTDKAAIMSVTVVKDLQEKVTIGRMIYSDRYSPRGLRA
jgi:hypothetical protein